MERDKTKCNRGDKHSFTEKLNKTKSNCSVRQVGELHTIHTPCPNAVAIYLTAHSLMLRE